MTLATRSSGNGRFGPIASPLPRYTAALMKADLAGSISWFGSEMLLRETATDPQPGNAIATPPGSTRRAAPPDARQRRPLVSLRAYGGRATSRGRRALSRSVQRAANLRCNHMREGIMKTALCQAATKHQSRPRGNRPYPKYSDQHRVADSCIWRRAPPHCRQFRGLQGRKPIRPGRSL
jgi:hypothetical protein